MPIDQTREVRTPSIRPNPANVRTHPKKQIRLLARIIQQFGFVVPIIVDENDIILAGHGRWLAAKLIGLRTVPVIKLRGLSEAEKRAFMLADNKIAEKAGWDRKALAEELGDLAKCLEGAGIDFDVTGFEPPEFDALLADFVDPECDPADELPEVSQNAVSRANDLWLLNKHRLLCGSALDGRSHKALMAGQLAAMIFADPPYNVSTRSIQGRGRFKHGNFAMASGEMSAGEFIEFLRASLRLAARWSADGSIHFVCIDWRHFGELLAAGNDVYIELKNLIVWVKTNAGQGTFYRSQHELILVFKNGESAHLNNFELGQNGRHRSNVWTYPGANSFRAGRLDDLAVHPTVKPVALVADAMRDCSRRGDIVLDPFMGSGTTILAAERVGRRAYGLEIDPLFVDAAIRRWQAFTKRDAVLESTGQTFDELANGARRVRSRSRRRK
jgi:DNA modification methylase